ncbi:MAG: GDSL-type esterase/lipase family protein [Planctomycetota bacterium]|nr:GDSL-type esterase/lipase family protein [Planctomycetota bacterium]
MNLRQKAFSSFLVVTNAVLWAVPSDVLELIARNDPVLLGRYSRGHLSLLLAMLIVSLVGLYIDQARSSQRYRRRAFQVITLVGVGVPGALILDAIARLLIVPLYVCDSLPYRRASDQRFQTTYEDVPSTKGLLTFAPEGHPPVTCVYTTDATGFRNLSIATRCDILILGDSFAEGNNVSDEHAWPVVLAELAGLAVYNLGMSGYGPQHYLASFEAFGQARFPKVVMCMLYEGNDFERKRVAPEAHAAPCPPRVHSYFKNSPIRMALDRGLLELFGGFDVWVPGHVRPVVSWLPLAIPDGPEAKYYAFGPKGLVENSQDKAAFESGQRWIDTSDSLLKLKRACDVVGSELIILYAPTKARVVLPLVRPRIPLTQIRAFAALRRPDVPDPETFAELLFRNLPAREAVVRQWCRERGVRFLSTTDTLRESVAAGRQVYFTYDHHWTPLGHRVVAELIHQRSLRAGESMSVN